MMSLFHVVALQINKSIKGPKMFLLLCSHFQTYLEKVFGDSSAAR